VCEANPDTLQSLLDKSLLRRVEGPLGSRYLMLETIRELAAEKLGAAEEIDAVRRRHAEHYLALARSANLDVESDGEQRHELVAPERDNLRAVLTWVLETGQRELGLELLVAVGGHFGTSSPHEGADWAAALLEADGAAPEALVARALLVQGQLEFLYDPGDLAEQHWEEALAISRRIGDTTLAAIVLQRLSSVAVARGELSRGRQLAEESLAGNRETGFRRGEAYVLWTLANVARAEGDLEGALELFHESRRVAAQTGFRWWVAGMHANIAALSLELGRVDDARRHTREALVLSRAIGDRKALVYEIGLLAEVSAKAGQSRHAGTLWGAAEAENDRMWAGRWLHGTVEPEHVLTYADEEFERGRSVGREISLEDAIALAFEGDAT
jgi:predicted ATPase